VTPAQRALVLLILAATAAPAEGQFLLRYDRRGKNSLLSIRIGSGLQRWSTGCPWYGGGPLIWTVAPSVWAPWGPYGYGSGGGLWYGVPVRAEPAPQPGPPGAPTGPLLEKYTRWAQPPGPVGPALDLRVQALVDEGLEALKAGDARRAVEALRGALVAGPESARLEMLFGLALAVSGDRIHADRALASALARVPAAGALVTPEIKPLFPDGAALDKILAALQKGGPHGRLSAAFLILAAKDDPPKARAVLEAILADDPQNGAARKLRALLPP
jgi:hypothetical protein